MRSRLRVLLVLTMCATSAAAQTRSSVLLAPAPPATDVTFTGINGQTFTYDRVLLDLLVSPAVATLDCTAALDTYCDLWRARGFQGTWEYSMRYAFDGTACQYGGDAKAAGLGASMFFAYGTPAQFRDYIEKAFSLYDRSVTPARFKDEPCLGYFAMFPIVNFGMGLGRHRGAYAPAPIQQLALVASADATTHVTLQWSGGASSYLIERRSGAWPSWQTVATITGTSYGDNVAANDAYAYRITGGGVTSNVDIATTFAFRSLSHINHFDVNEIVDAANRLLILAGVAPRPDLHVQAGQRVAADHLETLRALIDDARSRIGGTRLTYLQPDLVPQQTAVAGWDIRELRDGLR